MATFNYDYINPNYKETAKKHSERKCLIDRELGVKCYKNALVIPFKEDKKGEIITENLVDVSTDFHRKIEVPVKETSNVKEGREAILIGVFWIYVWGHCFTDHFNKLWFAFTDECKKLQAEGAELIALSCIENVPVYIQQLFELTGFDWSSVKIITETTRYAKIYVPDSCYFQQEGEWNRFYTKEYVLLLEKMKDNVRKLAESDGQYPHYDRIYLTRTQSKFGTYRDLGEEAIEKVFRQEGYTIVAPEKLTIPQQLWLMMNVKDLVATDGSICHASAFCPTHTKVSILMKADFLTENQIVSDQIADLDVTYVSVHRSFFARKKDPWHGPFLYCVTENLERYFNHKIPHTPLLMRKALWLYLLRKMYIETLGRFSYMNNAIKRYIAIKQQ